MRIVVDGLPLLGQHAGIGRSTLELLRQFPQLANGNDYIVNGIGPDWAGVPLATLTLEPQALTRSQRTFGRRAQAMHRIEDSLLGELLSHLRRRLVAQVLARNDIDVFFAPNFLGAFHRSFKTVITIHDMAHHHHPEAANPVMLRLLRRELSSQAVRAHRIVTVSEHAKGDIVSVLGVPAEKVVVVPHGVSARFGVVGDAGEIDRVRHRYRLPERFVLFVGTVTPRKNIETLVRAFDRLIVDQEIPHGLVIAGGQGWKDEPIHRAIAGVRDRSRVVCTGYVDDADLPALYRLADVLVLPSLYEGFGMPVHEAMACGTPVIASSVSSLPEVVGDAGLLFDPRSVDELLAALRRLLRDGGLRQSLVAAGLTRARQFTWERAARSILDVLEEVAEA